MKKYLLKEYGSWGVMTISWLAGIAVTRSFNSGALLSFAAFALCINSKQALTLWFRGGPGCYRHAAAFLAQAGVAAVLLVALLGNDILLFLPYAILPLLYPALNRLAGEHALPTEIVGFFLLTLPVLVVKYVVASEVDPRLYFATAVFFTAGVFKLRVRLRRNLLFRAAMLLYLIFAIDVYYFLKLPVVALLPLLDNLLFSLTLYDVKLKVAGWVEVGKGLAFVVLMSFFYR